MYLFSNKLRFILSYYLSPCEIIPFPQRIKLILFLIKPAMKVYHLLFFSLVCSLRINPRKSNNKKTAPKLQYERFLMILIARICITTLIKVNILN